MGLGSGSTCSNQAGHAYRINRPLFKHCESTAKELQALAPSRKIIPIACDVTNEADLEDVLRTLDIDHAGISIGAVFANAGVIFNNTIMNSSIEDWETTLNVNVMGVVKTIKTFLPRLQAQTKASVFCNTASVGGLVRGDGGAASLSG